MPLKPASLLLLRSRVALEHAGFSFIGEGRTKQLVVWDQQPIDYDERRLAVDALHHTWAEAGDDSLAGILYWKLSTRPEHDRIEPFVLHVSPESTDALQMVLLKFLER